MLTRTGLTRALVCLCVLLGCSLLHAQANGSFSGTVADKTGSVIRGAKVTVTSQGTGVTRESTTDASGHYLLPLLPVATYTLRVQSTGFQPVEQKDVRLQVDESRELDFTLAPASVTESVQVSAAEVAVETTNAALGQVITSQQVAELPLNGRDFVQLATLTPGTTQETNPQSFFNGGPSSEVSARGTYSLSVGGSRAQSTDWLFDGNDNNELTAGGIAILPSIDAIEEFKVLTYNYSAEYGTRAGPTVLVTTKSGSNQFHGSLFEFFRNTKLDASSFFAATREQFNLNQFGGALGGPIKKDKTYFFLDYQGKRQRHGIPFVGTIPTPAMKTGDFTGDPFLPTDEQGKRLLSNPYADPKLNEPTNFQCVPGTSTPEPVRPDGDQPIGQNCAIIPSALIDPVGQKLINLYPNASPAFSSIHTNYANVPVRRLNEGEFDIRVDHNISTEDSVFARFSYDQAVSFVPGGSPGFAEQGAFASTQDITNHGRNAAISETHIFSDHNINQINFGFNRIFNHILSLGSGTCEAAVIGIQGADLGSKCNSVTGYPAGLNQSTKDCISCGLSSIQMSTYWSLGDRGFSPFQGGTNVYSLSDTMVMIRGNHTIRAGIGIRGNQMNVETNGFGDGFLLMFGSYTGDAAADLLLGQIGGAIHDQTFEGATTGRRWKLFRPFVQDDWRVNQSLTVNIGLAWALATPISEAGGRQANFDFSTGKYFVAGNSSQRSCGICIPSGGNVGIQFDKAAFEPRVGFAWKPLGREGTVLRAGYGIFHDSAWSQGAQGLWQNPPYYAETDNFNGLCAFRNMGTPGCGLQTAFLPIFTAQPDPSSFTGTIQSQDLNFKQGMVQQYNVNLEQQLPANVVLTMGYAGSRSSHILVDGVNENVSTPIACQGGPSAVPGYKFGCGPGGAYIAAPYGPFTVVANNTDTGSARYDSLQLKAETKSARHGLYGLVGYTWSRTFDSGFPDGLGSFPGATYWPLPGTQKADWGLSQLNLDDQFTASVIYDLPFGKGKRYGSDWMGPTNAILGGWQVNVIEKATSGFPLFVVDSNNQSGVNFMWNGNVLNRPDQVGDPNRPGPEAGRTDCPARIHTVENWFNPCAFQPAQAGELGNASRAPVSGPRFVNTDFSLIKNFPLPFLEGTALEFRAEFFNLFNHPQFFLPGGSSGMQDINSSSSFGVISQTVNNPRVSQLALKLTF